MNEEIKLIWAYHSMRKGTYDNDYYFYEDGTILHRYDLSVQKYNLESYISPDKIPDSEKVKIIEKCEMECNPDVVSQIRKILNIYK